jgi:CheY-like chemotaxis protein
MSDISGLDVLFVDDSAEDIELYADYFDSDPVIQPVTAMSAEEGLDILSRSDIDCVVSDGVHTDDGEPLVAVAKETYTDIPILLHSGRSADRLPTDVVDEFLRKVPRRGSSTALETLGDRIKSLARPNQSTGQTGTGSEQEWRLLGTFNWTTQDSAVTVIQALAEQTGSTDLGPLYDHVDPGALNRLMSHSATGETDVHVRFDISGYTVWMSSDGTARYTERTD